MAENNIIGLKILEQAIARPAPAGFEGGTLHDAVRDLLTTYHDLNPTVIDELDEEPSPLEFMRYVARNRPFVVRKGAENWKAHQKWNSKCLSEILGDTPVNVAITPYGNADSVLHLDSSAALFVKPLELRDSFSSAMTKISKQALDPTYAGPAHYLQTQNDNLRGEYATLFSDVPKSIPWARIALEKEPDAINFWLGNNASTTALHKDNYENVYVQVLGGKHFVLLPPVEAPCVNEKAVLASTYTYDDAKPNPSEPRKEDLVAKVDVGDDGGPVYVPFATWDPDVPDRHATPYSQYSRPLRVTLDEGDMLYLPALWYHKVSQSCNDEGLCCAVNYWYDLEFSGGFWATNSFVRGVGLLEQQHHHQRQDQNPKTTEGMAKDSTFASEQPPQSTSNAEKSNMLDHWVREWQQQGNAQSKNQEKAQISRPAQPEFGGNMDGSAPQAWSQAEKSNMFDQWVREWQGQQAQAQAQSATQIPSQPPPGEGQPQSVSNAERNNVLNGWMQDWMDARKK